MTERSVKQVAISPTLLVALSALVWPSIGRPALPPAAADVSAQERDANGANAAGGGEQSNFTWRLPPLRFGGSVAYQRRRDIAETQSSSQQGVITTLNASTRTYLWQPWIAQLTGSGSLMLAQNSNNGTQANSVGTGGSLQVLVLPQSRFPFEAHYDRTDNRSSGDMVAANANVGQRFGFTQRYVMPKGDASFGWDRTTQSSATGGGDQQDAMQLSLSRNFQNQSVRFNGAQSRNTRELTGESATQSNLSVQDSYLPSPEMSIESMGNLSQSGYQLVEGANQTSLMQLSSLVYWRPSDMPMTVSGSARLFSTVAESSARAAGGAAASANSARANSANFSAGMNYEVSRFLRVNAGANVNLYQGARSRSVGTDQNAGVSYQPDFVDLGKFRYNWGASGNGSNSMSGGNSSRSITGQLSHGVSRGFPFGKESMANVNLSESFSDTFTHTSRSGAADGVAGAAAGGSAAVLTEPSSTLRVTHSASLSWNVTQEAGSSMLQLSASDSRSVVGAKEFFQMVSAQASSNLPSNSGASWTGNLSVQGVRQGREDSDTKAQSGILDGSALTESGIARQRDEVKKGFTVNSSASLSFQHPRAFGIRRLRFSADLRLNGQALLPLLGGPMAQETSALDSRFDYAIGRMQLRLTMLIAKNTAPGSRIDRGLGVLEETAGKKSSNKSIGFSVTRSF